MVRPLVVASLTLLLASKLDAQRADTSSVPRELLQALLTLEGLSDKAPSVVVGKLPEPSIAKMVPQASTVLGGMIGSSLYMGSTSVTVLSRRDAPDSAMRVMRDHLERLGLRAAPEGWFDGGGGFAPTAREVTSFQYCGDSLLVTIAAFERTGGGSLVKLGHRRGSLTNTMCDRELQRRGGRPMTSDIPIPPLRPPPGATGGSRGSSQGTDHREVTARVESDLSAAEIVAHYAAQMQQAGWILGSRISEGDVALQTMRRTDEKGVLMFGVLTGARFERHLDVSLRVTIPSKLD